MIKETTLLTSDQVNEKDRPTETASEPTSKKQFVEPSVSAAADVLDATTFFQAPTIESATT